MPYVTWNNYAKAWYITDHRHEFLALACSKYEVFEWLTEHSATTIDINWVNSEDHQPYWVEECADAK
tara:strand:- start:14972 stop:15172 length:201 start_codon:yes stop_codon:yes gene_type:complete